VVNGDCAVHDSVVLEAGLWELHGLEHHQLLVASGSKDDVTGPVRRRYQIPCEQLGESTRKTTFNTHSNTSNQTNGLEGSPTNGLINCSRQRLQVELLYQWQHRICDIGTRVS
jgi:hypothetical protein